MLEQPAQQAAPEPYGHQNARAHVPQIIPAAAGSAGAKVWGVILMIFGGYGLINVAVVLMPVLTSSSMESLLGMVPEGVREEMTVALDAAIHDMSSRWSFWVNLGVEVVVALLSIVAGYFLAIRSRPIGRSMAIARAVLVLAALPLWCYESFKAIEMQLRIQSAAMFIDEEDAAMADQMEGFFSTLTTAVSYGAIALGVVFILLINGLMLYYMTRPTLKGYLEHAATTDSHTIPQYDPSMGLQVGQPSDTQEPSRAPAAPPAAPKENQT